ncbi:hypothetical protein VI817_000400 [Penicillium citrinum]|nr:hypothetical protein VI817_000400 [Penicillium citrinum]
MPMEDTLSIIEEQVKVVHASIQKPDVFTNSSDFWRPGAHGIFGGFAIAQSLSAAQHTVAGGFVANSLHGSFVYAGNSEDPVLYYVERNRDGNGFCTRSVRALQKEKPIFICTISFAKQRSPESERHSLQHSSPMPLGIPEPENTFSSASNAKIPFINRSVGVLDRSGQRQPEDKLFHQWFKSSGPLSSSSGPRVHQSALAFMSDSYFLAGVPHSHDIWHFANPPISEFHPSPNGLSKLTEKHSKIQRPHLETHKEKCEKNISRVSMMVSLDHTIYFHNMENLRADEWLLSEVRSSWAGDGRGLVQQRIWARNGTLLATCIQEVSEICAPCKTVSFWGYQVSLLLIVHRESSV